MYPNKKIELLTNSLCSLQEKSDFMEQERENVQRNLAAMAQVLGLDTSKGIDISEITKSVQLLVENQNSKPKSSTRSK